MTFFILGTHPDLARAEILSVLPLNTKVIHESPSVLVLEDVSMPIEELQNRLGGTIKIGTVLEEFPTLNARATVEMIAANALKAEGKNKITFGLSAYEIGNPKETKSIAKNFRTLGGEIKALLKESGRPVRFAEAKDNALTSVVVETNGLLESGGEFVYLVSHRSLLVGKTQTVQNFEAWSRRDFGRPSRDSRSGMLPPKLARIMINLAGVDPKGKSLFDPFCGSGTVLMEAALMGFEHVVGSDISEKAIMDSKMNNDWLYSQSYIKKGTDEDHLQIFQSDAKSVDQILKDQVDVIVAETYLGPPRRESDARSVLEKMIKDLIVTYRESFKTLATILKPTGIMVIAFPAFVTKADVIRLPLSTMLKECGLKIDATFMYRRPDQQTAREIVRIKKV